MEIDKILEEIENLVASSGRMPFVDKIMVDDSELYRLMDLLRAELPKQIQEANEIVSRRDETIEAAQSEAARIVDRANREAAQTIEKANAYAQKAIDQNEIILAAREQEKAIMEQTMAAAQQLKAETEEYANQLRSGAQDYAYQIFDHVIGNVSGALQAVKQARDQLNDQQ